MKKQQCFLSLKNQKKQLLVFHKILWVSYKIETQKVINFLNSTKSLNLLQKWYVMDSQTVKDKYNQNKSIKSEVESFKSSLCDYSDALILVTADIAVTADNNTNVAFNNCVLFSTYQAEINDVLLKKQIILTLQCRCTI